MKTYKRGEKYYYINEYMQPVMRKWIGKQRCLYLQNTFNIFESKLFAQEAIFEIKYLLKQYNE